ncbi:MAG TPA: hypothetical protein VGX25_31285 [Actinophytocola sp.]|uniref:hypothetical protein n=1 Tax=Actinophytocola sp. TaxID=1872138 RepID=UPI002DDD38B5|nr:hypothetical protein [Actinophytocola sp.]HEV2783893.1 hypothetical protein [Actinophytocola sp.]
MTVQTMRADGKQVAGAKANLAPLLGSWVNSKPDTDYIARIEVSERDGTLLIRPYGSADGEPIDWGEAAATPYVASGTTEPAGFHARYELGTVHTELAANEKFGILVIQSYTSFHDDSGRLGHYSREFFHQGESDRGAAKSLVGQWRNSNTATEWIKGFTIADNGGTLALTVQSAQEPTDWGTVEATPYRDNLGEPAFHAVYDLGSVEAVLCANTNKRLIIIAAFLRFKNSTDTNFLCREFYYRQG